ncbi:MAG: flippase-like domain-containing protein [Melioribacteraceae bacterium]|nr:flippase-like domain-containing protein [Melioribacteraceae bacterium]
MTKIKKIFGYLFPLVLMVLFLYLAFSNIDFNVVFSILKEISIVWLVVYLIVWFLSHVTRAIRWRIIIHSVKKETSLINLFGATMVGYGVNCVVPRLGELYRGLFLGKWENISRSSMVGTIVIERVIDIIVLGFSVLISVAIYSGDLFKDVVWLKSTLYLGFLIIFLLVVFLYLLVKFKEKFYNIILRYAGKISTKLADGLGRIFHLLTDGFASLKGRKNFISVILLSVAIMLLYGLTAYIGFYILHMDDIQSVSFSMAWIVMTISAFGVIIPTPGATGSYHLIVISVLVGIFNFSSEISGAYALLTHATTYILFILSTIFSTYFINKKQASKGLPVANFITVFKTENR